jgi:acetyl/propionyl-CoA carboxylase alpha subunit
MLSFRQGDLKIQGHAIEIRVYAEDPENNFLPDIGLLSSYRIPQGPGVRVDDGYEEGMEIPIYYDSMIAKLITYGKDRKEAIEKMIRAIDDYKISGVKTTLEFCRFVMTHEAFINGKFDTHFISNYFKPGLSASFSEDEMKIAAMVALQAHISGSKSILNNKKLTNGVSDWKWNRLLQE